MKDPRVVSPSPKPLRIAMLGAKGIPAMHGGIERHVDEIAQRLVTRGHRVDVFQRPYHTFSAPYHEGVRLRSRPCLHTKHLDAASHTALCMLESIVTQRYDIIHLHGIGPGIFLRWAPDRVKTVFTYHAQDWRQKKWGSVAKWFLRLGERTALQRADAVIAVSKILESYVVKEFSRDCTYIPNGAVVTPCRRSNLITQWKLEPRRYLLFVGRIIADRGIDTLIDAYARVPGEHKLVLVGDVHLDAQHFEALQRRADPRVLFLGYQGGDTLQQLYSNAYFCIHPSEVEGLPIAVLEAMAHGKTVLVSDIPENLEVVGDTGKKFEVSNTLDLALKLEQLLMHPSEVEELGQRARTRVEADFNWDSIAAATESVYRQVVQPRIELGRVS